MIGSLAFVLALLLAGETVAAMLDAPIPGAVFGLATLGLYFTLRGGPAQEMERLFDGVAQNAPMLFVPAAVGVIADAELMLQFWAHLAIAIILGTTATLIVAGWCMQALVRRLDQLDETATT